ncbi:MULTISPECIES: class I SAM-dependent methyltransferase [unclassified Halorhodospira]|uniref:class I SAM-dependent methyltransferase n=1 Tax=unclassified Halorhodospira TaxID=2626748 RepID=UPI001EE8E4A7|nr:MULTISPECIES: class I SAM-dependent methyltransferase [unclassified Halorhodospira]MCG5540236.1 class I SAM-dependent methyltransferase [Halorhodospira sp. M39old]MCG5545063.1 class I SAM-dependent methyltransferase [Halorhodospira sp. M38]
MNRAPTNPERATFTRDDTGVGGTAPHPVMSDYYGDAAQRQQWVDAMFDATAEHYDWITDFMSLGSGRWYRRWALQRHGLRAGMHLLDAGAGTGVIAKAAQGMVGEAGSVVALDPSRGMLDAAERRGVQRTVQATAEDLPFPEQSFDMLTMGYALRHVGDLRSTFDEYFRVLGPSGRVLILEITPPRTRLGYRLLRLYLRDLVPRVAGWFRRSQDSQTLMQYYWDTVDHCVPPDTIVQAMEAAGFREVRRHVVMGIFSEYTGVRPETAEAG